MHETHVDVCSSLVDKIYNMCSDGLPFARPTSNLRANEADLVQGVLKMLQGFSSPLFYWDQSKKAFCIKSGMFVSHLSRTSLYAILNQFNYAATCLQLVDLVVDKVKSSSAMAPPTLRAFACSVSSWTKRLRDIALREEIKICSSHNETAPTLLGLASSLSSLCSGAEHLLEIVHRCIPPECFQPNPAMTAAEMAVHILDYLYQKLHEACLVPGGEEEAYRMLLYLFSGSIMPYIECLDSWLYEGTLDDPFEELFFHANKEISLEDAEFWEKSYLFRLVQQRDIDTQQTILSASRDLTSLIGDKKEPSERDSNAILSSLRGKEWTEKNRPLCPLFVKDIAKSIVSAGKSLQLIRHVPSTPSTKTCNGNNDDVDAFDGSSKKTGFCNVAGGLSLSEIFSVSLVGLLSHGDHLSRWFKFRNGHALETQEHISFLEKGDGKSLHANFSEKMWWKFLVDTFSDKREVCFDPSDANNSFNVKQASMASKTMDSMSLLKSFCPENPAVAVCNASLMLNVDNCRPLNISKSLNLPPLNDEVLWNAIFCEDVGLVSKPHGTDFTFGFQFSELIYLRQQVDRKLLKGLFPFPTLLPCFEEEIQVSQFLPFQKNSTLPSEVLRWIQDVEPMTTPFPLAIMQECLVVYIERQVDIVGKQILSKLMNDWRLMEELAVLRAIYLLGSGDLLQHFLTVLFNKLDREEAWDDDFDLNTILQESIRNSADGSLLSSPDSLVVSIVRSMDCNVDDQNNVPASTPRKSVGQSYGIDGLDSLKFTYKVSWPLELVANMETIKRYNQVMGFLLKVKRAKFVLDKTRRWMWKGKGTATYGHKHHWLVEQKLLHFVDAFHQYVMDRVYHNSWRELCEGAASAASLDEVMEVHEAYLMSIQRQCFVVPDKLWALISYRINIILGLALDFYSVQQTLSSGGAVPAVKARCDMKVEQIEKQFDDCIAFLLRVLSFKLNVGNFPHLADLVTRINYNYFYMSDSGSLKPTTSVENASSKLGKPFPGRKN